MPFPPRWIFYLGLIGIAGAIILGTPQWEAASHETKIAVMIALGILILFVTASGQGMYIFWWFWGIAAILGGGVLAAGQLNRVDLPAMSAWQIPENFYWYAKVALFTILALWAGLKLWAIQMRLNYIASLFDLAEAELNELISRARGHGGRKGRVAERYEWYDKLAKKEPAIGLFGSSRDAFPPTVSDTLIEANETETQLKRKQAYQMTVTAMFLRMLYNASPEAVKAKIAADTRENGRAPFIAAGIEELSEEHWRLIDWVVRRRGYPMSLTLIKEGTRYTGMDVIDKITQE